MWTSSRSAAAFEKYLEWQRVETKPAEVQGSRGAACHRAVDDGDAAAAVAADAAA